MNLRILLYSTMNTALLIYVKHIYDYININALLILYTISEVLE